MKRSISLFIFALASQLIFSNVKMPVVFGDNMVLQRDMPCKIWGWADKGEKVTVQFNGQTISTVSKDGTWMISLKNMKFGGPFDMKIKGKNEIFLKNILIGDVWICSGQSNMEWVVYRSDNHEEEIKNANYPAIRHIDVPNKMGDCPKNDIDPSPWMVCSPKTVASFSAVAYFFARELYKHNSIPIGLIGTNWGGTNVEAWTSADGFSNKGEISKKIEEISNIEEKLAQSSKDAQDWVKQIKEQDLGLKDNWNNEQNFAEWTSIGVPGSLEKKLGDFDGIVWIAREFYLTEKEAQHAITLNLGEIDDNDITYLNGQEIGATLGYNVFREYKVESKFLKAGRNIVVIRIEDTGGGSGLSNNKCEVVSVSRNIDLLGNWYARMGVNAKRGGKGMPSPNDYGSSLYNAMIHPFINYTIKGAIWYQGEANAKDIESAKAYSDQFMNMIKDWRNKWGQGDFPFLFVQLANFEPGGDSWPYLRESQNAALSLNKVGMAVTIDVGNPTNIHPTNKQDVGYRLSLCARNIEMGENIEYMGPLFKNVSFENGKAIVEFTHISKGLQVRDRYGYLKGFAIAGSDKNFYWAKAEIVDNKVIITCDKVSQPEAVRYGWEANPADASLINSEGLPASPFRSDNW